MAKKIPYAKTDSRYWANALFHQSYRYQGKIQQVKDWYVRIQHSKRRETFDLGTANKQEAAATARDVYFSLKNLGWDETLRKFKTPTPTKLPLSEESQNEPIIQTVGDYMEAAEKINSTTPRTFADYCRSFRRIVADIEKIKSSAKKYDYVNGGRDLWIQKIHAVPLENITPSKIAHWKSDFLDKHKRDPRKLKKAKTSVNSFIRQAKSLFSQKLISHIALSPGFISPFRGVAFEKRQSMRYRGEKVAIGDLIQWAQQGDEKNKTPPLPLESWKIFLLAVGVGLRRKEIDLLEYSVFDFKNGIIDIQETEYFRPKSEDSIAPVEVDEEIMALFNEYKMTATGAFVIESDVEPRPNTSYASYRCEKHFRQLIKWLRDRGFKSQSPIHALRKEFGSRMCERFGIFVASRSLRHADVAITAQHYLEKKTRTTAGFGADLAPQ